MFRTVHIAAIDVRLQRGCACPCAARLFRAGYEPLHANCYPLRLERAVFVRAPFTKKFPKSRDWLPAFLREVMDEFGGHTLRAVPNHAPLGEARTPGFLRAAQAKIGESGWK